MKKKVTRIGWTSKNAVLSIRRERGYSDEEGAALEISGWPIVDKRGSKNDWDDQDWPPKKVEITVKEV